MASKDLVKGYCKESKCAYDVYTKEKTDELLNDKANSTDVYSKTESYSKEETETLLSSKSNSSDVYIKDEVYPKENYAVLTGTITLSSGSNTATINYPTGFNVNNSIVISVMTHNSSDTTDKNRYSYGSDFSATGYVRGGIASQVALETNNIYLSCKNINITSGSNPTISGDKTFNYKIVIMKIS